MSSAIEAASEPVLPWDVLLHVAQYADIPTLVALSRVSLEFLAGTHHLLYRNITVTSSVAINSLFSQRARRSSDEPSRIDHLLSLSVTKTLSLTIPLGPTYPICLFASRFPTDRLVLDVFHFSYENEPDEKELTYIRDALFLRLDPIRCDIRVRMPKSYEINKSTRNRSFRPCARRESVDWLLMDLLALKFLQGWPSLASLGITLPSLWLHERIFRWAAAKPTRRVRLRAPGSDGMSALCRVMWDLKTWTEQTGLVVPDQAFVVVATSDRARKASEEALNREWAAKWRSCFAIEVEG